MRSLLVDLVLLATIAVPALGVAFGAPSMAAGVALVCGLYIALLVMKLGATPGTFSSIPGAPFALGATIVAAVVVQSLAALVVTPGADLERSAMTQAFLLLFVSGAAACSVFITRLNPSRDDRIIKTAFWALVTCGVAGVLGVSPFFDRSTYSKSVVVFSEPSHFALDFLPFLAYALVQAKRLAARLALLGGALALAYLLQNATFVVGLALVSLLVIRWRYVPLLAAVAAIWIALAPEEIPDLDYYTERVNPTAVNASTLIYQDGWERAYRNTVETWGFGVGFQQFGIVGDGEGRFGRELTDAGFENFNLKDGSTVGSKLVAEFGVVGILLIGAFVARGLRVAMWLRRIASGTASAERAFEVFFACSFVMFAVDLFIRGTGYFNSTAFLFVASVMSSKRLRRGTRLVWGRSRADERKGHEVRC